MDGRGKVTDFAVCTKIVHITGGSARSVVAVVGEGEEGDLEHWKVRERKTANQD